MMLQALITHIDIDEIHSALFGMNKSRAPGVDGFNVVFFQKAWHVIKSDLCADIQDFFSNGTCIKVLTAPILLLLLKSVILLMLLITGL